MELDPNADLHANGSTLVRPHPEVVCMPRRSMSTWPYPPGTIRVRVRVGVRVGVRVRVMVRLTGHDVLPHHHTVAYIPAKGHSPS